MSFAKRRLAKSGLLLAALLSCCVHASVPSAAQENDKRAALLLRESVEAPKTSSYVGQVQTVRFSSNGAAAVLMRVEHKAPALTRRWFLAPEALYGDYIITRGPQNYRFNVKRARVVVSRNSVSEDDAFANGRFDLILRNYRPVFDDVDMTAGRSASSILLINKYTGERAMRLWIDNQTHLLLRNEEFRTDGAIASQMRFEAIRYTNAVPEDIFNIATPAGFTRTQGYDATLPSPDLEDVIREAGFRPYTPQHLPQGFLLSGGSVAQENGVKTLHLTYTDGLRTISLFENDKGASANFGDLHPRLTHFAGHDARYIEDGSTTLLTWEEHDLHFALAGELGRDELQQIAAGLVLQ